MDISNLIQHPEQLDRDTLYELRNLLAQHPYYQTARLLMLQNLYLLHDPTFNEELRRSAIYISNREKLFNLVEGKLQDIPVQSNETQPMGEPASTVDLIEGFLQTIPQTAATEKEPQRKPTPADATIDYVAYLLETQQQGKSQETTENRTDDLIDTFLTQEQGVIQLNENEPAAELVPEEPEKNTEFFTETLAKIYIRQGRYEKALEIIRQLNLNYPKKSVYFADQIRFLEKLIINNNKINNTKQ